MVYKEEMILGGNPGFRIMRMNYVFQEVDHSVGEGDTAEEARGSQRSDYEGSLVH